MNLKNIFCFSLCFMPMLSFADASLNMVLKVQDKETVIENAVISEKKKGIFKDENIALEAKVLSEDDAQVEIECIMFQDGDVISQLTFKLEWEKPATLSLVKQNKNETEQEKSLEFVVVANKIVVS